MGPVIKQPIESCSEYHGLDGFGDVPDFHPSVETTDYSNIKKEKAVLKLTELIEQNPGEIDLLAIGWVVDKVVSKLLYLKTLDKLSSGCQTRPNASIKIEVVDDYG